MTFETENENRRRQGGLRPVTGQTSLQATRPRHTAERNTANAAAATALTPKSELEGTAGLRAAPEAEADQEGVAKHPASGPPARDQRRCGGSVARPVIVARQIEWLRDGSGTLQP